MRINKLILENFMNIANCSLTFRSGINVLHGENGQGKSAVFEAIAFCLVDRRRGDSWKDYVRKGTKGFTIQLEIELPDGIMAFNYEGFESKGSVKKQITYQGQTYTNSECDDFLARKFDLDMLKVVLFALQDGLPISAMPPAERRAVFKKLFNSDFPEIIEKIKADQTVFKAEEQSLTISTKALQSKTYPFSRTEDIDESELVALRAELEKAQENSLVAEKLKMYSEKVTQFNLKNTESNTLIDKKASFSTNKESLLSKMQGYTTELVGFQSSIIATQRKLTEETEIVKALEVEVTNLSEEVGRQLDIYNFSIRADRLTLAEAQADVAIHKKYKITREKGLCPECGATHEKTSTLELDEIISKGEATIHELNDRIASNELLIKQDQTGLAQLNNKKINAEASQRLTKSSLDTLINSKEKHESSLSSITTLMANVDSQISDLDSSISRLNTEKIELSLWLQLNEKPVVVEGSDASQIQKKIEEFIASVKANEEQEKTNARLKVERDNDNTTIQKLGEQINTVQLKLADLDQVIKIFEIEFPSYINLQACEILQEYMNNFMSQTKQGFTIRLQQDKKGINFYYKAGDEPDWNTVKMTSGFESALLTLAFKCSVAFAYGSDLIILDEPDGPASESNSERLFTTISNIVGFKQMFVITHKPLAMEYFKENGAYILHVENGVFSVFS